VGQRGGKIVRRGGCKHAAAFVRRKKIESKGFAVTGKNEEGTSPNRCGSETHKGRGREVLCRGVEKL